LISVENDRYACDDNGQDKGDVEHVVRNVPVDSQRVGPLEYVREEVHCDEQVVDKQPHVAKCAAPRLCNAPTVGHILCVVGGGGRGVVRVFDDAREGEGTPNTGHCNVEDIAEH
jgi:hypothetical protein